MTEVTAYLAVREPGIEIPVGEMAVHVRANYDEAFPFDLAADVFYEDAKFTRHAATDVVAFHLLRRIKEELPEVWREIKEMAESNHIEGCAYDASGSTYFSHEAA
jgi:hypothetical protein